MATRRGRDNFRFTMVELGALAVSFTVTSVLVFVLGFYVGRRVSAEHAPVRDNVARIPIGAPPAEVEAPRPAARARTDSQSALAALKPPAVAAAPGAKMPAAAMMQAPGRPPEGDPQPGAPALTPPGDLAAGGPPATLPGMPRTAPPGVPFTVQVLATRNRIEAETLASDLKSRGFGAYVAAVDDAGGSWYRVRIGHYEDAEAARRTAERAARELGLTQAYVSPIYSDTR